MLTHLRGRTLDVGAGDGGFSFHLRELGFQPNLLLDLDERARAAAQQHLPDARFRVGSFEELSEPDPFDAIIMSQVLEHALDPIDWLRRAHSMLSPGGVLAVALPNFNGVYRLLGNRDPFIIPPIHLNYFTPASLRLALTDCDLRVAHMDSRSDITPRNNRRGLRGLALAATVRLWNFAGIPLNSTSRGIILRAFATRPYNA